ncbi:MAG: amino acid transport protein [Betaproteobacteria bacterium]
MNNLFVAIVAGAFGMAYFVYGKRQSKFVPVICGVLLCIFPYFTENLYAQGVIAAVLLAAPFIIDY